MYVLPQCLQSPQTYLTLLVILFFKSALQPARTFFSSGIFASHTGNITEPVFASIMFFGLRIFWENGTKIWEKKGFGKDLVQIISSWIRFLSPPMTSELSLLVLNCKKFIFGFCYLILHGKGKGPVEYFIQFSKGHILLKHWRNKEVLFIFLYSSCIQKYPFQGKIIEKKTLLSKRFQGQVFDWKTIWIEKYWTWKLHGLIITCILWSLHYR